MTRGADGAAYPHVMENLCVSCGLCKKVCDFAQFHATGEDPRGVFAARMRDANEVATSRSGGFFMALCHDVIDRGGIVFGSRLDEDCRVVHVAARTYEECHVFKGSKYVESNLGKTFSECREALKSGTPVLFSGTGCQVHALLRYLETTNTSTENLLTVDIICHGAPTAGTWDAYRKVVENREGAKMLHFNFRDKSKVAWENNMETYMPGFTHLQKAQPITLAHHMAAYFEMFGRDRQRMHDIYERMNYCPLGSGALAGTTYPLDREYTAELLGFYGPTLNSMDGVSDRDYLIELMSALSTIMMHLSRFSEEVIIWNSNEYQFVDIDDSYSTGSSIMPQKKNPDIAELVRGKTGRVYGALTSILTTMKGIPLAYNKDMQEDKELVFDAIDTVKGCLALFTGMLATMKFNKERMLESCRHGFTNATDAADYLVNHGVPFRDAHGIVGKLVLYCIDKKIALDDMSLEEYKEISPVFEEDIYDAISMETCVNKRNTIGAPGPEAMKKVIALHEAYLEEC